MRIVVPRSELAASSQAIEKLVLGGALERLVFQRASVPSEPKFEIPLGTGSGI